MKDLTVRLSITGIAIIVLIALGFWLRGRVPSVDKPLVGTAPTQVSVTPCDILHNPDHYHGKDIRVRAIILGYHELALYDLSCKGVDNYIRADFDPVSRKKLVNGIADLKGAGFRDGNFWAEVALIGRFEKIAESNLKVENALPKLAGHKYIKYHLKFIVQDVEQVNALPPDVTWPP